MFEILYAHVISPTSGGMLPRQGTALPMWAAEELSRPKKVKILSIRVVA